MTLKRRDQSGCRLWRAGNRAQEYVAIGILQNETFVILEDAAGGLVGEIARRQARQ